MGWCTISFFLCRFSPVGSKFFGAKAQVVSHDFCSHPIATGPWTKAVLSRKRRWSWSQINNPPWLTNRYIAYEKSPLFPGKYHQNGGFSSQRTVSFRECIGRDWRKVDLTSPNSLPGNKKVDRLIDFLGGSILCIAPKVKKLGFG